LLIEDPTIQLENFSPAIVAAEANSILARRPFRITIVSIEYRPELIVKALAQTARNRAAAARLLHLERSYLLRPMKSFLSHFVHTAVSDNTHERRFADVFTRLVAYQLYLYLANLGP
jgi:DNA-binding NtrC family response regulator